MERYDD